LGSIDTTIDTTDPLCDLREAAAFLAALQFMLMLLDRVLA
jgi:hypothetical protein